MATQQTGLDITSAVIGVFVGVFLAAGYMLIYDIQKDAAYIEAQKIGLPLSETFSDHPFEAIRDQLFERDFSDERIHVGAFVQTDTGNMSTARVDLLYNRASANYQSDRTYANRCDFVDGVVRSSIVASEVDRDAIGDNAVSITFDAGGLGARQCADLMAAGRFTPPAG